MSVCFVYITPVKYIALIDEYFCFPIRNYLSKFCSRLMAESFNICENVMLGHATANGCQAPTHLALLLSQSLCKFKIFSPADGDVSLFIFILSFEM